MGNPDIIKAFTDLGVTGAFLLYLYIRNGRQEKSIAKVFSVLDKNNNSLDRNTKILIKVAMKHKLLEEADELIKE